MIKQAKDWTRELCLALKEKDLDRVNTALANGADLGAIHDKKSMAAWAKLVEETKGSIAIS